MTETERKIRDFANLPNGWHYGSGKSPSAENIERGVFYSHLFNLYGFSRTNAFPGIDGEVMVTAYADDLYLEILIETDGKLRFVHEKGDETILYKEGLSNLSLISELAFAVNRASQAEWRSSVSSIRDTIGTPISQGSKTWHFAINRPPMAQRDFPVSTFNVPSLPAEDHANTSNNSISNYLQNPLSSGRLNNKTRLPAAA